MAKYPIFFRVLLTVLVLSQVLLPYPTYAGLVPCGLSVDDPNQPGDQARPCTFCDFFVLFENIVDFVLFQIVPPLAVLIVVIGGVMFLLAAENPARVQQAKNILTTVAIGLLIIYGAWLIVNLFFVTIGVADWTGLASGWAEFQCNP